MTNVNSDLFDNEMSDAESAQDIEEHARLKEESNSGGYQRIDYYNPFGMEIGQESTIRFLPHTDLKEDGSKNKFLQEADFHEVSVQIPNEDNEQKRSFLCLKRVYGEDCPFCEKAQEQYKHDKEALGLNDSELGKQLYHKVGHIAYVKIIKSATKYVGTPYKPLRIRRSLSDVILEQEDSKRGLNKQNAAKTKNGWNFVIEKTKGAKYVSYASSGFDLQNPCDVDLSDMPDEKLISINNIIAQEKPSRAYVDALFEAFMNGTEFNFRYNQDAADSTPVVVSEKVKKDNKKSTKSEKLSDSAQVEYDALLSDMDDM